MSVGPGLELVKDIDISKVELSDWVSTCEKLMQKWVAENPEDCKQMAEEVISMLVEYENLKLDK